MSTYAIGDIQGSYKPLMQLLERIKFDPSTDNLWLAGDLVNRGPDSLAVLRFFYQIRHAVTVVLGNHDLHLLAVARGHRRGSSRDTLHEVLQADDRDQLLDWLRHAKLLHHDPQLKFAMVHAGIPPQWSLREACLYAQELERVLHRDELGDDSYDQYLAQMYGNHPATWQAELAGYDRLRLITNYFTRMRFCTADGTIELETKTDAAGAPPGFLPWFAHPERKTRDDKIIFGHWAALQGQAQTPNIYALDTGCAWGGSLTALRLEDEQLFSCDCAPFYPSYSVLPKSTS
jgi:bis(5'-nucleosyl)-tetraphosphatase (symmetrical)